MLRVVRVVSSLMWLVGMSCLADDAAKPSEADLRFFESRIRPLLLEKCGECHGAETQENHLRLDTWAGLRDGGDAGPAVVPGKPDRSLLFTAVTYRDSELKMPPDTKLSPAEIADLKRWIEMGAPHPDMLKANDAPKPRVGKIDYDEARQFWSFRPIERSEPPETTNAGWCQTDIDRFILAKLESQQLSPSPPADKRTLIRRASIDLTGLPPAAREIDDFLADDSPEAFAKVIDRLLDSPHYGERWGRHWLDVARYADSNGLDENIAHGNAWRYRDWVVSAFNRDVPYDEFLLAQIAGDLLPFDASTPAGLVQRNERLIATGFLAIGPKVLAEVDEVKMEMDIIDEQLETLGRSVLGLTIGCTRCHDHKFDPLTMGDYYGLAGIFKSTKVMEHFKKIARWQENPIPTESDLAAKRGQDERVAQQKTRIEGILAEAKQKLLASLPPDTKLPDDFEKQVPEETKKQLAAEREQLKKLEADAANLIPTAMGAGEGKITDLPIHRRGSHLTLGETVTRRTPELFAHIETTKFSPDHSGRLELARWITSPQNPLTARVIVNRIWRWHFGQGLVRSADNFGRLGETPSHPGLLDWLADEFRTSGWSFKRLHRLILLSAVYQQSSELHGPTPAIDPENRLYWRFDLRRMDAEVVRDSLLAVSGLLDRTMGGSLVHVKNREFFFDHTSKDTTKYDSRKRTLYLPVVRNHLYDVLQLFDATDATVTNGDRNSSTVAPQALFLMNSDLIHEASAALAQQMLADPSADDRSRLERLYSQTYGRPASDAEAQRMLAYLVRHIEGNAESSNVESKRLAAWQSLCHVVLSSNEFLYVR